MRGTFSKANQPKVDYYHKEYNLTSKNSLFQQVQDENLKINRNQSASNAQKKTTNEAFSNVMKTFAKCQTLKNIRYDNAWSQRDQDMSVLNSAVGGH